MAYTGPIVDVDVHHTWKSTDDLFAYIGPEWREYAGGLVEQEGDSGLTDVLQTSWNPFRAAIKYYPHPAGTNKRLNTFPPEGGPPCSSLPTMREQLLEGLGVDACIVAYDVGLHAGITNPYFAAECARAGNRWSTEQWLSGQDDRIYGGLLVAPELPDVAAAEVRSGGQHDRMVEVRLVAPAMGKPFGHPHYHPIYEAAVEMGMTVGIHAGGEMAYGLSHIAAGGPPAYRFGFQSLMPQNMTHHAMSFITHGVFEKFPELTVVFIEAGVTWAPMLFTELDSRYQVLRRESSWVRRLPSEYFREHMRLTTQPFESPSNRQDLIEFFHGFGGMEDVLCFATDYPHWDADDPRYIERRIPNDWVPKVFAQNAIQAYPRLATLMAPAR